MKSYRFYNDTKTVDVTYITDSTTSAKLLSIVDVKSLNDADVVAGMNLVVGTTYYEEVLKQKAEDLLLNLEITNDLTQISDTKGGASILTYSFAEETGDATIDDVAKTVAIEVANGTDASALVATFTASDSATVYISTTEQESGVTENDFSSPVEYIVTSEAGKAVTWTVTVTVAEA